MRIIKYCLNCFINVLNKMAKNGEGVQMFYMSLICIYNIVILNAHYRYINIIYNILKYFLKKKEKKPKTPITLYFIKIIFHKYYALKNIY